MSHLSFLNCFQARARFGIHNLAFERDLPDEGKRRKEKAGQPKSGYPAAMLLLTEQSTFVQWVGCAPFYLRDETHHKIIMQDSFTLITGASSGFGQAIARTLAEEGRSLLIITARRKERLQRLAEELSGRKGVEVIPLCFDVRRRDEVEAAAEELKGRGIQLRHLINNAGLALGLVVISPTET